MERPSIPTGGAAPNPRDEEAPPEPERAAATIEEHRFQRPIVSPVPHAEPEGVRTGARGG